MASTKRTVSLAALALLKLERVDDLAAGEGALAELVFKTNARPSSPDLRVSESVLVDVDGAVDLLARVEIGNLRPLPDQYGLNRNAPNPFNPATAIGYQLPEAGLVTFDRIRPEEQRRIDLANRRFSNSPDVIGENAQLYELSTVCF